MVDTCRNYRVRWRRIGICAPEFPGKVQKSRASCWRSLREMRRSPPSLEFDHILPDALWRKPELANCMVLCRQCHKEKTAQDVKRIPQSGSSRRTSLWRKAPPHDPFNHAASPRSIRTQAARSWGLTSLTEDAG